MARVILRPSPNKLVRPTRNNVGVNYAPLWVDSEGRLYHINDPSPARLDFTQALINDKPVESVLFNDWKEDLRRPRKLLVWVAAEDLFEVLPVKWFDRLEPA